MTGIRNTTADFNAPDGVDRRLFLASAFDGDGGSRFIEAQERAGQRQLVQSDRIPAELLDCTEADLEALGFTLGPIDQDDPLFRPATLPDGWTKKPAPDHDMWSYIHDEHGRRRVGCFYKAAFYDREAHTQIKSLRSYVDECVYYGEPIVADGAWATPDAIREELAALAAQARERVAKWAAIRDRDQAQQPGTETNAMRSAARYIPVYEAEAEKYEALLAGFQRGGE